MNSKFSENLKYALKQNEITQKQLADIIGTTQATINRWIKGINEPSYNTLIELCLILNETPNSILGFDEIPKEKLKNYIHNSFNNSNNSGSTFNF